MKWIGLVAAIALISACFFPWVFIESKNVTVSGIASEGTSFGKPGYFHFVLAGIYLLLHFIQRIWSKRLNILVSALNTGWAVRNYFLISACSGGECPEKKTALYVLLASSVLMLIAALLPNLSMGEENQPKE